MNDQNVSEKNAKSQAFQRQDLDRRAVLRHSRTTPSMARRRILAHFTLTERGRDYKPVVPKLVRAVTQIKVSIVLLPSIFRNDR